MMIYLGLLVMCLVVAFLLTVFVVFLSVVYSNMWVENEKEQTE